MPQMSPMNWMLISWALLVVIMASYATSNSNSKMMTQKNFLVKKTFSWSW